MKLFEDLRSTQQRLYDYHSRIQSHSTSIPPDHLQEVADMLSQMRGWEADVRSGKTHVQQLQQLLGRSRAILCNTSSMLTTEATITSAPVISAQAPTIATTTTAATYETAPEKATTTVVTSGALATTDPSIRTMVALITPATTNATATITNPELVTTAMTEVSTTVAPVISSIVVPGTEPPTDMTIAATTATNESATKSMTITIHNPYREMSSNVSVGDRWNRPQAFRRRIALAHPRKIRTNIDETRYMAFWLIRPMALIAQSIAVSITVHKRQIEELRETMPINFYLVDGKENRELETRLLGLRVKGIQIKTTAIEEYQLEYNQIQTTAIQFGLFLKVHGVVPRNDVTLDYISMLIDNEKKLIQRRLTDGIDGLNALEKYRAEYILKVEAFMNATDCGNERQLPDDAGIRQAIECLCGLRDFGEDLRAILSNKKFTSFTFSETVGFVSPLESPLEFLLRRAHGSLWF